MKQWDAKLYDHAHRFVSEYGQSALALLNPQPNEFILDLGCGTGDMTQQLYEQKVKVVGIDNSKQMIMQAKEKYPDIHFEIKDILELDYDSQFDAVFSNAVLHWIKQPRQALKQIYASLKTGGRFVAEFGGQDNVQKVTNCLIQTRKELGYAFDESSFPWYFPSIGNYTSLMEHVGFKVVYATLIDRPTQLKGDDGLRNWLTMFAKHFYTDMSDQDKKEMLSRVQETLSQEIFHNNEWIVDYKRLRIKGIKVNT